MKIKAILFDLDNTLYPSRYYVQKARKQAIKNMLNYGLNYKPNYVYDLLLKIVKKYGSNYPYHFDKLLALLGFRQEEKYKLVVAGIIGYHSQKYYLKPYNKIPNLLNYLKKRYSLYVATEGIKKKQLEKLLRLKLDKYFKKVFVSRKKTTKFYKSILRKLRLKAHQVVMIGDDQQKDILIPSTLGIHTFNISAFCSRQRINKFLNKKYILELKKFLEDLEGKKC